LKEATKKPKSLERLWVTPEPCSKQTRGKTKTAKSRGEPTTLKKDRDDNNNSRGTPGDTDSNKIIVTLPKPSALNHQKNSGDLEYN